MSFNPETSKDSARSDVFREVYKRGSSCYIFLIYASHQDHCSKTHGTVLDEKLNYNTPVKEKLSKVYKSIQLHRNLSNKRSRQSLVAIWKVFIRPHLDYGDTVYNKPNNEDLLIELKKHNMI